MTARQLILIRHAKADSGPSDEERPLTERGERDATALGRWLAAQETSIDRVAVSPALRAQQTWNAVRSALTAPATVEDERIYANTVDDLLAVVHDTHDDVTTFAVVGHNPGLGDLAAALDDGAGDATARAALAEGFPTASAAVFAVPSPWADVAPDTLPLTTLFTARASEQ
ncbi:MAG: SixA phosphatase family protein [Mycobacteriales bacterium]